MLLHDKLKEFRVILASASPRRRELLKATGIEYQMAQKFECEESFPKSIAAEEVAPYLSALKSHAYPNTLEYNDILITADTVVVLNGKVLGKPTNEAEAYAMLSELSGSEHTVITGVTLRSADREHTFASSSTVRFAELSEEQIAYYIEQYRPMDKAGAYGIQGKCAIYIEEIDGDYNNVVGLPISAIYHELQKLGIDIYLW